MGLTEELEALRQRGSVKSKSTLLSESVTKHGFTSPESEASKLKQKSIQEKQSRLDAQAALSKGASGLAQSELNLLYKKLIDEQRKKKREAELNLREWRKQHVGKDKDGKGSDGKVIVEGEGPPMPSNNEEDSINMEALEMLPQHVVAALKEKYETNNAAEALSKALKEESEHDDKDGEGGGGGGGMLAKLMEVTATGGTPVKGEMPYDEASEHSSPGKIDKEDYVVVANDGSTSAAVEEDKIEEKKADGEKETKTAATLDEPVEEVREKVEQLTLEDQTPSQDKEEDSTATPNPTTPSKPKPDLSHIPNEQRIEQTKRFYNVHSQEYIEKLTSSESSSVLTPTKHRDAFMTHVQSQQNLNDNEKVTLLDLGCGFGRDTKHFVDMGHYVLGIDYSYEMLNHAKSIAPKAHYLNMDIRQLKNVLVDQSLDGVWANASLLHLPKCDVLDVLKGMFIALKVGGVLFVSFKVRNGDDDQDGGEVFEADERYMKSEIASPASEKGEEENVEVEDDTRRKLYSYYTEVEVRELLENANFDVIEMGTNDLRESSEYAQHAWIYAFATRRKE